MYANPYVLKLIEAQRFGDIVSLQSRNDQSTADKSPPLPPSMYPLSTGFTVATRNHIANHYSYTVSSGHYVQCFFNEDLTSDSLN